MKITCYGSRGSLPSPSRKGFPTTEFGGNTSCYFVEAGDHLVILDAGSGIKVLGDDLMKRGMGVGRTFIHLITHYHWDHIQGLPFFVPYYIGSNSFEIHGQTPAGEEGHGHSISVVERMLAEQQSPPHFPVAHETLPAKKSYVGHPAKFSETFNFNGVTVTTIPLNHPDGCLGYRIDFDGKSVAYCTDNEPLRHPNAQINRICKDVDLLILDGQYTEEQVKGPTQTFGHGTPMSCVEQAVACGAKHLWVHHHDVPNDDAKLAAMEVEVSRWHAENINGPLYGMIEFSREGKTIEL